MVSLLACLLPSWACQLATQEGRAINLSDMLLMSVEKVSHSYPLR